MREIVLFNRQRLRPLRLPGFRAAIIDTLQHQLRIQDCELGFHFVGPRRMAGLNLEFLGHSGPTDVITFDQRETNRPALVRGEIFICVAVALEQAREFHTDWREEVLRYALHGLLHLLGWDDLMPQARRRMKARENQLVRWLGQRFPLQELSGSLR